VQQRHDVAAKLSVDTIRIWFDTGCNMAAIIVPGMIVGICAFGQTERFGRRFVVLSYSLLDIAMAGVATLLSVAQLRILDAALAGWAQLLSVPLW
jgi:hypothetical protein